MKSKSLKNLDQYMSFLEKHIPVSVTDTDGVITYVSEAFCTISGYSQSELIGKKHNLLRHPDMDSQVYETLWDTITKGQTWHGRLKNRRKNKEAYWVDAFIAPIFDDGEIIGYQALRHNVTDETFYASLAQTDTLTGLYNRHSILEFGKLFVEEARRYQLPFSIIMVDVDDFKHVNDTYGHPCGDQVLSQLAEIFQRLTRSSDRIGRWGGEEFIILCPQTSYLQAKELAERLRIGFSSHEFKAIGSKTASFGVAYLDSEYNFDDLINRADKALYQSKKTGKNKVT